MLNLSLKVFNLFFFSLIFTLTGKSQILLDSAALDSAKTYRSIESALKNPDKVYRLVLKKQKLKEFPLDIIKFKNLNYLDLSKNKIKEIPSQIQELKGLQYLRVTNNKITKFNPSICNLKNLKELALYVNEIDSIPDEIGNLENLEVLDMWSNHLAYYPSSLKNLKKLKLFDISAILINNEIKQHLRVMLPKTKINWEESCGCSL